MTVCEFWNGGACKFGPSCWNEHPTEVCPLYQLGHCPDQASCHLMHPTRQCNMHPRCPKGLRCRFRHVSDRAAAYRTATAPRASRGGLASASRPPSYLASMSSPLGPPLMLPPGSSVSLDALLSRAGARASSSPSIASLTAAMGGLQSNLATSRPSGPSAHGMYLPGSYLGRAFSSSSPSSSPPGSGTVTRRQDAFDPTALASLLDADELLVRKLKPVLVFLVNIDVSASMHGARLAEALTALGRFVTGVVQSTAHAGKVFYGCTTFNHEVHVLHRPMPKGNVSWLREHSSIVTLCDRMGRTALYDAAISGVEQLHDFHRGYRLQKNEFAIYEHLLITDGCDVSSRHSLADAMHKITHPGLANYHFHAVSVGINESGARALRVMALPAHAQYVAAKDAAELSSVLDDAREQLLIRVEAHGQQVSRVVSRPEGLRLLAGAMGGGSASVGSQPACSSPAPSLAGECVRC